MKIGSLSLIIILLSFRQGAYGHSPSVGKVLATAGPYVHQVQEVHVHDNDSSPADLGFGILGEGDLSTKGGLEMGFFYGTKTYEHGIGGGEIAERVNKLSVPVGFRYWIDPKFSACLAFNASYTMGVPKVIFNTAPPGADTSARSITEYGIDFSGQWEPWSNDKFAAVIDARYFYSLTAEKAEDGNQFAVLIGLKYLIQEKSPE